MAAWHPWRYPWQTAPWRIDEWKKNQKWTIQIDRSVLLHGLLSFCVEENEERLVKLQLCITLPDSCCKREPVWCWHMISISALKWGQKTDWQVQFPVNLATFCASMRLALFWSFWTHSCARHVPSSLTAQCAQNQSASVSGCLPCSPTNHIDAGESVLVRQMQLQLPLGLWMASIVLVPCLSGSIDGLQSWTFSFMAVTLQTVDPTLCVSEFHPFLPRFHNQFLCCLSSVFENDRIK